MGMHTPTPILLTNPTYKLRKTPNVFCLIRFWALSIRLRHLGVENTQFFKRTPNFEVPGPKSMYVQLKRSIEGGKGAFCVMLGDIMICVQPRI